jgi:hypothetical protein
MLIKNVIYIMSFIIGVISIISLIMANKNKNIFKRNWIKRINLFYIFYLILGIVLLNYLLLPYGFEIFILYFIDGIATVLYIISIVVCKKKKDCNNIEKKSFANFSILMILLPGILLISCIGYSKYLINNSDVIMIFHSRGNGGFDGTDFAYAINEKSCTEFDLGIDFYGYAFEKFAPANAKELNRDDEIPNYRIEPFETSSRNRLEVYYNDKLICNIKPRKIHNNEFKRGFYIEH